MLIDRGCPDIFGYERVRPFLQAWRAMDRRRTYEALARPERLASAVAQVHGMFNTDPTRRSLRISPHYTEAFVALLRLPPAQAEYFRLLVRVDEAETAADRGAAERQAALIRRLRGAGELPPGNIHLLDWHYFAIFNLVQLPGFRDDPEWIASVLRPQIPAAEVTRAIDHLLHDGVLARDPERGLHATRPWLGIQPEQAPDDYREAMRRWHRWFVEEAPRAFERFDASERDFRATVVNVPAARHAEVVQLLKQCQEQILALCEGPGEEADRVFVVTSQLFPLTSPTRSDPAAPPTRR